MDITLKNVRLSFNELWEPTAYKEGQKPSYSAKVLVEKGSAQDKMIWKAIRDEAVAMFGKKAEAVIEKHKNNNMKFSYSDGDMNDREEEQGMMVLNAKRRAQDGRPTVVDRDKSQLTPKDGKPYSGCYVNLIASIYCQKGEFEGVRCGLKGLQFSKDGDAFSGSRAADPDAFEDMGQGADEEAELE